MPSHAQQLIGLILALTLMASNSFVMAQEPLPSNIPASPSQNNQTVETLTLDRALSIALEHNLQIQAARKKLGESNAGILLAKTRLNPSWVSDLGFFAERTYRVGGIQQVLEPFGKRRFRIHVAQDEYEQAQAEVEDTVHHVLENVHQSYTEWIAAKAKVRFQQKNSKELKTIAEVAKKRYGEGQVDELDVNQSMLLYLQAENEIIHAKNDFERAQLALARLLNTENFKPPAITSFEQVENDTLPSLDILIQQAMNYRNDLKAKQAELRAETDRLKLYKRSRTPNLMLTVGFDMVNPVGDHFISGIFAMGQFEIPIFDRQQGNIARTLATQERLVAERETLTLQIRNEIETSYRQVTYNQTQWHVFQTNLLPLADIVDQQALESYQMGKTGINDVIGQHQNAFNVRQEALDTFIAYHQSIAELEAALSKRLTELDQDE